MVSGKRGRPYQNLDATLNGIWWVLCTGSMWNQMPEEFGKWNSVWRMFRRWCESGLWQWAIAQISEKYDQHRIAVILDASYVKAHQDACKHPLTADHQKLGKTKGGCNTKISMAVNLAGLPLAIKIVCGNEFDSKSAIETLRGCIEGNFVLADKAYDTNEIRNFIDDSGGFAAIPNRGNRIAKYPYDNAIGKLRYKVENAFARLKRFRRVGEVDPKNWTGA